MKSARAPSPQAELSLAPVCGALIACALLGAFAAPQAADSAVLQTLALVSGGALFLFGAALPVLVRWSPVEPSLLKLVTLSALFSPVLASGVYVLLRLALPSSAAVPATYAVCGALQLLGLGRRVARPPLGRAGGAVLALAVACAAITLLLLFRGSAARVSHHGLLHSALVLAVDRNLPPDNPFLAGTPLAYYWFWHAQGALLARALALAPTRALALTNVWAAFVTPLALYFLAASFAREGRRELTGVVLAVFGLGALGGCLWIVEGFPWRSPATSTELLRVLSAGVGEWDARLAFGFSKFGNPSSHPTALALACGALACAAHALRHGARPWVGATSLSCGAALLANPILGGIACSVVATSALLLAPGLRARILVPLALWALPGALLALEAGRGYGGEAVRLALFDGRAGERAWGAVAPVLLLLVPLPFALRRPNGDCVGHARVLGLLLVAAFVPLVLAAVIVLPYDNQYKLVRFAAVPLGILAAKGIFDAWDGGRAARVFGALSFLAIGVGVLANNALGFASYAAFSSVETPLVERPLFLGPRAPSGPLDADARDLASAYAWLAREASGVRPAPVLIVDVAAERATAFGAHVFTDPRANLQGHEAAPFTGIDLWCDRPSQALDPRARDWLRRVEAVARLYREPGDVSRTDLDRMQALERPVLVLVTPIDRGYNPDVEGKLSRAGFARAFEAGGVSVFSAHFVPRGEGAR